MVKDVKWFKITTDIFDDEKIKYIESMPDSDTLIVIWFKLLSLCAKSNNEGYIMLTDKIPYTQDMLVSYINRKQSVVQIALQLYEKLGMIEITDEEAILISNWHKHQNMEGLERIRQKNKERQKRFRNKNKELEYKEKDIDIESNVTDNVTHNVTDNVSKKVIDESFDEVWSLYPRKEGKGKIKDTKRKDIHKNKDEYKRCVERYKNQIEKERTDKKFIQHGSTFFNSGYVDFLDKNYQEEETPKHNHNGVVL